MSLGERELENIGYRTLIVGLELDNCMPKFYFYSLYYIYFYSLK